MKRRALVIAGIPPLGVIGVAGVALAFWSVTSSGASGSAAAASLTQPTVSTSNVAANNVTINVTAAPVNGPTPSAYRVARTGPGTPLGSVCSITGSTGSCDDPSPEQGATNSYSVYAQVGSNWEAATPATTTANVPGGDLIAPTTTATPSQAANGAGWNNANVTITLAATDNVGGSGVKSITYSETGAQTVASTTVLADTTDVTINTEGTTTVTYHATDNANNDES